MDGVPALTGTIIERMNTLRRTHFILLALLLIGAATARSAISTRLDSFTEDEAYHIAAGVSYVRYGDFRINPEHPPLVKLWIGAFLSGTGFQLGPLRRFNDKPDERSSRLASWPCSSSNHRGDQRQAYQISPITLFQFCPRIRRMCSSV